MLNVLGFSAHTKNIILVYLCPSVVLFPTEDRLLIAENLNLDPQGRKKYDSGALLYRMTVEISAGGLTHFYSEQNCDSNRR